MTNRPRSLRVVVAVLVVAILVSAIVFQSWVRAQTRTVVVLSITQKTPVLAWAAQVATRSPRVTDAVVAGRPVTIARPGGGDGPWPAVVFANGATRRGRHHPKVQRLARGLARAGFLVVVPDLPGLRLGEITPMTTLATVRVARATAARRDVRGGHIAFYGVSVGATLALLAAEEPTLADRVTVVAGEAPWVDLKAIIRLATTGFYRADRCPTDPYASLAIARSLAAGLRPGPDRARLLPRLEQVSDDDPHPLERLRGDHLGRAASALVALLLNKQPERFERLYAKLPPLLRVNVRRLSPLYGARRLRAQVELASAPHDKYFPPAESRALARRSRHVRVTVTSTLDHAVPRPSLSDLGDLFRFDAFVVRFFEAAA